MPKPPSPGLNQDGYKQPMDYFLHINGQQSGPFTISQLSLMLRTGQAASDTLYWADSLTEWLPLSTLSDELHRPDASRAHVRQVALPVESHCSRGVYIILGIFLGLLGIHNFYAGRMKQAVWQLVLDVLLCWTLVVPVGIAIWVIVELCTVTADGKGRAMK